MGSTRLTSEPRPQAVVVSIQEPVQDACENGDVVFAVIHDVRDVLLREPGTRGGENNQEKKMLEGKSTLCTLRAAAGNEGMVVPAPAWTAGWGSASDKVMCLQDSPQGIYGQLPTDLTTEASLLPHSHLSLLRASSTTRSGLGALI